MRSFSLSKLADRLQLPIYSVVPLIFALFWNCFVYYLPKLVAFPLPVRDLTTGLDRLIPLTPAAIIIYIGSFAFWIINYILCGRQSKERVYSILCADFFLKGIALLFFLFFPTTNVRPSIPGTDVFARFLTLIYAVDTPTNLFPSVHCINSVICTVGIQSVESCPKWYQKTSYFITVLIFMSTLLTHQHVIADLLSSCILCWICIRLSRYSSIQSLYRKIICFWEGKLLGIL